MDEAVKTGGHFGNAEIGRLQGQPVPIKKSRCVLPKEMSPQRVQLQEWVGRRPREFPQRQLSRIVHAHVCKKIGRESVGCHREEGVAEEINGVGSTRNVEHAAVRRALCGKAQLRKEGDA